MELTFLTFRKDKGQSRPEDIHGSNSGTSPGQSRGAITLFQVAVNDLLEVRPSEPVGPFEELLVDLNIPLD